jgi:type IV secretory pathway TrbL component
MISKDWLAANMDLLQTNLKYAVLGQMEFEYGNEFATDVPAAPEGPPGGGAGAAAGANEGGRRQTRKKGRNRRSYRKQTKRHRR